MHFKARNSFIRTYSWPEENKATDFFDNR